jgi:hypothetical protein
MLVTISCYCHTQEDYNFDVHCPHGLRIPQTTVNTSASVLRLFAWMTMLFMLQNTQISHVHALITCKESSWLITHYYNGNTVTLGLKSGCQNCNWNLSFRNIMVHISDRSCSEHTSLTFGILKLWMQNHKSFTRIYFGFVYHPLCNYITTWS